MKKQLKSQEMLDNFVEFCNIHPGLRFWQALQSWSGASKIIHDIGHTQADTFYWEDVNCHHKLDDININSDIDE